MRRTHTCYNFMTGIHWCIQSKRRKRQTECMNAEVLHNSMGTSSLQEVDESVSGCVLVSVRLVTTRITERKLKSGVSSVRRLCSPYFSPRFTCNKFITAPSWPKQDPWNTAHTSCGIQILSLANTTASFEHTHGYIHYSLYRLPLRDWTTLFCRIILRLMAAPSQD